MANEKNGHALQIWEIHEERIQQIEHDRVEIATQVATQSASLAAIRDDISELANISRDTNKTVNQLVGTISVFEAKPQKSNKLDEIWAQWWGKILFSALTVGGGALLSLIMEHFGNH